MDGEKIELFKGQFKTQDILKEVLNERMLQETKPLEVMWLCRKHHMELHRKPLLAERIRGLV